MRTTQSNAVPKVSAIIPTYKTTDCIVECLDSVFAQTYKDFEAIVVNDGSPDTIELEKVLGSYMERIVYIKQENKRAAGARNTAIHHARGEFVAFLDSDDTWMPHHLAAQMQLFEHDPSLSLTYSNALVGMPGKEFEFMERCPSAGEATFESLLLEQCQIPISTVVARKEAITRAGMFDEKLLRNDDYDMWVRTVFYGARIAYTEKVNAYMRIARPGSLSESRAKMAEGSWAILEKLTRTLPLTDQARKVVEQRAAYYKARYLLEEGKDKLDQHQFDQARRLLSEANDYFRKSKLSLALLGLSVAPGATFKLVSVWKRCAAGWRPKRDSNFLNPTG